MLTSSEQIQRYNQSRHSTKLGRTIEQVDVLSRLLLKVFASDFLAVFYAQGKGTAMIPVAFHQWGDRGLSRLDLLERAFDGAAGQEQRVRRGFTHFEQTRKSDDAGVDAFAVSNGFRSRYLYPIYVNDELRGIIAAYWIEQREHESSSIAHILNPIAELLIGWMTLVEEIQVSDGFALRLSSLISLFDLPLDEYRVVDLVSRMLKTMRVVLRGYGIGLVSRDPFTGHYQLVEGQDTESMTSQVTDKLASASGAILAERRKQIAQPRSWFDLSPQFEEEQLTVILSELYSDDRYHFAAVFTKEGAHECTEAELELIGVFRMFSETILANARLVRDLKKANEKIKESSSRLADSETMAALADMSSGIAHDLNNTVGSVVGRLQLMKMKCTDEKLLSSLTKVESAALEASETVKRLQQFSSSVKAKGLAKIDLVALLRAYAEKQDNAWQELADRKRVEVVTAIDALDAVISATAEDVLVILDKLITNAIEFAPEGSAVQVTLSQSEKEIVISVADRGPGIPQEMRARIFYPFFTTKSSRGAGLGLAIVYGIVSRLGGKISVLSEPGSGSLFRLTFGRTEAPSDISEITRKTLKVSNLRVLVVDDDDQIRDILSDMLTLDGHAATTCHDGYAALQSLDTGAYDLMITDLGMPGMSGLDLAGAAHEKHPGMPIAMITGWGTQLNEEEIALRGIRAVIPKPFHLKDVKALVHKLAAPREALD